VQQRQPLAWSFSPAGPRTAWPAALLSGAVGLAAVAEGHGPGRIAVAIGLSAMVALPFAVLAVVEGRLQRQALHLRAGQIAQLRWRETWRRMSQWEVCDAVALLMRHDQVRIDWLPTPSEAEDAFFGLTGATAEGRRLVVRILRDRALDPEELARAVGRAVLAGAGRLVLVTLRGTELPRSLDPPKAPGQLEIVILQERDILARAEELATPGSRPD